MRRFCVIKKGKQKYGVYYRNVANDKSSNIFNNLSNALTYFYNDPIVSKTTQRKLNDSNNHKCQFIVYTDGGLKYGKPKQGSWAYIIDSKYGQQFNSGHYGSLPQQAVSEDMELEAIKKALSTLKSQGFSNYHVMLHCDCIGMELIFDYRNDTDEERQAEMGNRAIKKIKSINSLCHIMTEFPHLEMQKVKGHNGIPGNMFVDQLCTANLNKSDNKNNVNNQYNIRWFYNQNDLNHALKYNIKSITNILKQIRNGNDNAVINDTETNAESKIKKIINDEKSVRGNINKIRNDTLKRYQGMNKLYQRVADKVNTLGQLENNIKNAADENKNAKAENEKAKAEFENIKTQTKQLQSNDIDIKQYLHVDKLTDLNLGAIIKEIKANSNVIGIDNDFTHGVKLIVEVNNKHVEFKLSGNPLRWHTNMYIRALSHKETNSNTWRKYWNHILYKIIKDKMTKIWKQRKIINDYISQYRVINGQFIVTSAPITPKNITDQYNKLCKLNKNIDPHVIQAKLDKQYRKLVNKDAKIPWWKRLMIML